jgi:hypothetical protein
MQTYVRSGLDIEHPFGDSVGVTRTRVRRRRLVALALVAGAVASLTGSVANAIGTHGGEARPARTHVVAPGDTLWSIATDLRPGRDPRDVVSAIAAANGVDPGSLVPGQELVIPTG